MVRKSQKNNSKLTLIAISLIFLSIIAGFYAYNLTLSVLQPGAQTTGEGTITLKIVWLNGTDITNQTNVAIYKTSNQNNVMNISYWSDPIFYRADEVSIQIEENITYICYVNRSDFQQYEVLQPGLNTIRLIPNASASELFTLMKIAFMNNFTNPYADFDYIIQLNQSIRGQKGFGYRGWPYNQTNLTDIFQQLDAVQINVTFNMTSGEKIEDLLYSCNLTIYCNLANQIQILNNNTIRINILTDLIDKCEIKFRYSQDYLNGKSFFETPIPANFSIYYSQELLREESII